MKQLSDSLQKLNITFPDSVKIYQNESVPFMKEELMGLPFWFWQLIVFPLALGIVLFFVTRTANKYKEKYRLTDLWKFILIWINCTVEDLEIMSTTLQKLEEHYNKDVFRNPEFTKLYNNISRILSIHNEDLYRVFISKRKNITQELKKSFYDLFLHLEIINSIFKDYNLGIIDIISSIKKLNEELDIIQEDSRKAKSKLEKDYFEFSNKINSEKDSNIKTMYLAMQGLLKRKIFEYDALNLEIQKELLEKADNDDPKFYKDLSLRRIIFLVEKTKGVELYFADTLANQVALMEKTDRIKSKYKEFAERFSNFKKDINNHKEQLIKLKNRFEKLPFKSVLTFPG